METEVDRFTAVQGVAEWLGFNSLWIKDVMLTRIDAIALARWILEHTDAEDRPAFELDTNGNLTTAERLIRSLP